MNKIINRVVQLWSRFEAREQQEKWVRVIYRDGRPLITRYYLLSTRWIDDLEFFNRHPRLHRLISWVSFRLVMHHMHESDDDGLHDHPWPWVSLVLTGGYNEDTPDGMFFRPPGHLRFRPARAFHRLILPQNLTRKGVYTLFAMGRRQKEWGFLAGRDQNTWHPWYAHDGLEQTSTLRESTVE